MDNNLKLILNEFEQLKGQFVITMDWKVERLVAIGEDDMDYYYITYNGRKLKWNTCVGRLVQLKGKIDDDDYNEFERIADLNHYDRLISKRGKIEHDGEILTIDSYKADLMKEFHKDDRLLTNIVFESE